MSFIVNLIDDVFVKSLIPIFPTTLVLIMGSKSCLTFFFKIIISLSYGYIFDFNHVSDAKQTLIFYTIEN